MYNNQNNLHDFLDEVHIVPQKVNTATDLFYSNLEGTSLVHTLKYILCYSEYYVKVCDKAFLLFQHTYARECLYFCFFITNCQLASLFVFVQCLCSMKQPFQIP